MRSRSSPSAACFSGLWMSTSGSMIGTRPAATISAATSNCWSTTALTPASFASCTTERIFVPNTPRPTARSQQLGEATDRLHHLGPVDGVGETLVDLQERHDVLDRPEVLGRSEPADLAIHRLLEQDRAEHPVAGECR